MNELELTSNVFENIKHIDENGEEFWYARELQLALNYKEWRKFEGVVKKAMKACENSDVGALDHFVGADKMVKRDFGSKIELQHTLKYNERRNLRKWRYY